MVLPLKIDFLHMEPSEALSQTITEKCQKLINMSDHITHCHVTIESPHKHHSTGQQFQIGIQLSVPGKTLTVSQHGSATPEHQDAYVAVRDAFKSMQRQLKSYTDKQKGHVKNGHDRVAENLTADISES